MVSVCMATYNGSKYLKEQIDSVLSQLSEDDELIISDDASTDNTIDLIMSYHDDRIKLLHHNPLEVSPNDTFLGHKRASSNFENALKNAKGDFIFLSDQDDVWKDNKVKYCLKYLQNYSLVTSDCSVIDGNGNILKKAHYSGVSPIHKNLYANITDMPFKGSCIAFKSEILDYVLPFPRGTVVHDDWIGCLACHFKSIFFINTPLFYYRIHGSNISRGKINPLILQIEYRLCFLINIIQRILKIRIYGT